MKSKAGFTLIEVLIAMAVSLIILGSAYSVFISQQKSTVVQTDVSDILQNLRAAMDFLARDIRMAGFSGTDNGSLGSFGFEDVSFDSDGNGSIRFSYINDWEGSPFSEKISYRLSNSSIPGSFDLTRTRSSGVSDTMAGYIIALGLAFSYDSDQDGELDRDAAGNVIWAVDTDSGAWVNLDTNGDGQINAGDISGGAVSGRISGTTTGTPVRYQDIRAVRIWLLGRSGAPDNTFVDNRIYVVGRNVIQPNNNFRHRLLERTVLCRNMGLKK
jgi:prepilin-type N-terminal cleavage/methylation domain-containing protein